MSISATAHAHGYSPLPSMSDRHESPHERHREYVFSEGIYHNSTRGFFIQKGAHRKKIHCEIAVTVGKDQRIRNPGSSPTKDRGYRRETTVPLMRKVAQISRLLYSFSCIAVYFAEHCLLWSALVQLKLQAGTHHLPPNLKQRTTSADILHHKVGSIVI